MERADMADATPRVLSQDPRAVYMRKWTRENRKRLNAERRAARKADPERFRRYDRQKYERNRQDPEWVEKQRQRSRDAQRRSDWHKRNPERSKAIKQAYSDRNREKERERSRRYRLDHPELVAARIKAWERRHPGYGALKQQRRYARKKGNGVFVVTAKDLRRIMREPCVYCGGKATEMDHVIPLSRGGRHSIGNIVGACLSCNRSKSGDLVVEWRRRRGY